MKAGEDYSSAKKCVCINILNYKIFDVDDFHSEFMVIKKNRNELLTDKLDIHFFEFPKITSINEQNQFDDDMLTMWLRLIKTRSEDKMETVTNSNDVIKTGVKVIYELSADEIAKEQKRQRDKAINDYIADTTRATKAGKEIGLAIGKEIGLAIAKEIGKAEGIAEGIVKCIKAKVKAEGIAEGVVEGIAEDLAIVTHRLLDEFVKAGKITIEEAAEYADMIVSDFKESFK